MRIWIPALFVVAIGSVSQAEVLWRGDFSTGDLSQWSRAQTVDMPTRLRVVDDPLEPGNKALQASVRQGDNPIRASGNRSEVLYTGDKIREGDIRYYRWQTLWPENYPAAPAWQIFTQWHHDGPNGSPPLAMILNGEELRLGLADGEVLWRAPLERGRWHDFVVQVLWSSDPDRGRVAVWHDGRLALSETVRATLFPRQGVYLKHGLYRAARIAPEQTVFLRGMVIGTTLDDVWPPTPADPVTPPSPPRDPVLVLPPATPEVDWGRLSSPEWNGPVEPMPSEGASPRPPETPPATSPSSSCASIGGGGIVALAVALVGRGRRRRAARGRSA